MLQKISNNPVKHLPAMLLSAVCLGLIAGLTLVIIGNANTVAGPVYYSQAAPQLGIVINEGMQVVAVISNSPALKAGVQPGDTLKKLGVSIVNSPVEAKQAAKREIAAVTRTVSAGNNASSTQVGDLSVGLERQNKAVTLTLKPASPPFITPGNASAPLPTPTAAPGNLTYL